MTSIIDIKGVAGPMRVVHVPAGEVSGTRGDGKCTEKSDTVEFYDRRHTHTSNGQFVSNYCVDTLLKGDMGIGLDLMGYEPSWKVNARDMDMVRDWLAWITYDQPKETK